MYVKKNVKDVFEKTFKQKVSMYFVHFLCTHNLTPSFSSAVLYIFSLCHFPAFYTTF